MVVPYFLGQPCILFCGEWHSEQLHSQRRVRVS